jgi:hypothetical protein
MDIGYLLILLHYGLMTGFQNSFAVCCFRLLFSFVPFCGSEYYGSVEDFFKISSKGVAGECEDIEGYWLILDIY